MVLGLSILYIYIVNRVKKEFYPYIYLRRFKGKQINYCSCVLKDEDYFSFSKLHSIFIHLHKENLIMRVELILQEKSHQALFLILRKF